MVGVQITIMLLLLGGKWKIMDFPLYFLEDKFIDKGQGLGPW